MEAISISEARATLSEVVKRIDDSGDTIGITVQGRIRAVLAPSTPPVADGPWVQVARSYTLGAASLPAPFRVHGLERCAVDPILWLNTKTGAQVAAIPTGNWDTPAARFEIFYAHPNMRDAIPMLDWTSQVAAWSGRDPQACSASRDEVIALLHVVLPRTP